MVEIFPIVIGHSVHVRDMRVQVPGRPPFQSVPGHDQCLFRRGQLFRQLVQFIGGFERDHRMPAARGEHDAGNDQRQGGDDGQAVPDDGPT